ESEKPARMEASQYPEPSCLVQHREEGPFRIERQRTDAVPPSLDRRDRKVDRGDGKIRREIEIAFSGLSDLGIAPRPHIPNSDGTILTSCRNDSTARVPSETL